MSINKKRFIYNTHENAERPYYLSALLKTCTKPRESISINNLANLVHQKLRHEIGFPIPERAAPYLIQLAIELGILERDIYNEGFVRRWGAQGYVISNVSPDIPSGLPDDLKLLDKDRLAFLKYYLEADGITLLYLSKKLRAEGKIEQAEFLKGKDVELMWQSIIKESLTHARSDKLRSEMRELLKKSRFLAERPRAKGKVLEHVRKQKFTPHIEVLVDLDVVERSPPPCNWHQVAKALEMKDKGLKKQIVTSTQKRVSYLPKFVGSISRVNMFLECFKDPSTLDKILSPNEGTFFRCAAELYGLKYPRVDLSKDFELVEKEVLKSYELVRDDVYRLAFLDAIKDIVCINLQISHGKVCEPQDVWATIKKMHQTSEKDVRYHRDNYGVITYVALTESYVKKFLGSCSSASFTV